MLHYWVKKSASF